MFKYKHKKEADIEVLGFNHFLYFIDMHYAQHIYADSRSLMNINTKRDHTQRHAWRIQDADHLVNSGKIGRHNG